LGDGWPSVAGPAAAAHLTDHRRPGLRQRRPGTATSGVAGRSAPVFVPAGVSSGAGSRQGFLLWMTATSTAVGERAAVPRPVRALLDDVCGGRAAAGGRRALTDVPPAAGKDQPSANVHRNALIGEMWTFASVGDANVHPTAAISPRWTLTATTGAHVHPNPPTGRRWTFAYRLATRPRCHPAGRS
jgi:hypothetical protein